MRLKRGSRQQNVCSLATARVRGIAPVASGGGGAGVGGVGRAGVGLSAGGTLLSGKFA